MELHQLVYFVAIAETGSFSRAAERCNVAQPSISQQIMKLEQELDVTLFDRLSRRVVLTNAGRLLLPHANRILAEAQEIKRGLSENLDDGHGELAVGFIPTVSPFVLPGVIKRFGEQFPHAALTVREDLTETLIQDLIDGTLDVGIVSLPIHNSLVHTEELLSEPLLVASSRKYDIVNWASIRVKALDDFPFIALNEVHCLGEQVQAFCYQQNLNVQIVCHTAQLSTVQNCIALGLGVSLVPQALALSDTSDNIVYRVLSDAVPHRQIAAATRRGRSQSTLAQRFIALVREEYPTTRQRKDTPQIRATA
ncbi:LysR family transcriptional regulator [Aggregatilinea lenta]|uniref:LysR family transcriptional regulator n=1 Tax=Aggregatilinea lenta TaxID=913108 RepID=UPI0013C2E35A|nr:LysR family transcriptional regulator [Aggregatilinea lenta]